MIFDTSLIKTETATCDCATYSWGYKKNIKFNPISYYEHFINPSGYEIILLPFYTNESNIDLLKNNNFIIRKGLDNNEKCLFAYKKYKESIAYKKYDIVIMTLFLKENNSQLENFYKYYDYHGIDHYFMYFNGDLTNRPNLPQKNNVTYISWNFPYWCVDKNNQNIHHAQIPALLSFFKKYLPLCKYAIIIDTDEFLFYEYKKIKNYLLDKQYHTHLFTKHRWANINFDSWETNYIEDHYKRGKSIIYSDIVDIDYIPRIHKSNGAIDSNIELFHNNYLKQYNKKIKLL